MTPRRPVVARPFTLLFLVVAVAFSALMVANRADVWRPDEATSHAVRALVTQPGEVALAAVPNGFARDLGYTPMVADGVLLNPTGGCSSPVPLPAEFDPACQRHDLGYDLLRYATRAGGTLPGEARLSIDEQFAGAAHEACARRRHAPARLGCEAMADVASTVVRANTVRQHGSTPGTESVASLAEGATGASTVLLGLVGGLPALARAGRRVGRRPGRARVRERTVAGLAAAGAALRRGVAWVGGLALPRVRTTLAVLVGGCASTIPSLVPRSAPTQGVLSLLLAGSAVLLVRRLPRWTGSGSAARHLAVVVAAPVALALLLGGQGGQDTVREQMGLAPAGVLHWVAAALTASALVLVGCGLRWAWQRRARAWRAALGIALVGALALQATPSEAATASDRVLLRASPSGAVRVYADLGDGATAADRAAVAVDRLVAAGGLQRSRVVLAMPTGSGWVDPVAVEGFERRFGGDVATVSIQYAAVPSWVAYLLERDDAERAARALFTAVAARIEDLPADRRPSLHVYGESLGALAGQAIFTDPDHPDAAERVCSVLWVGSPGGARAGLAREALVSNATDPVVHTTPRLAMVPPGGGRPWVPVLSYLLAGADVVDSLSPGPGFGHRYGPDQVSALATC